MEQDCTGSRESRDILKVKRDVDNAVCPHPPSFQLPLCQGFGQPVNILKRIFTLNVVNYPFSPPIKRQQQQEQHQQRALGNVSLVCANFSSNRLFFFLI